MPHLNIAIKLKGNFMNQEEYEVREKALSEANKLLTPFLKIDHVQLEELKSYHAKQSKKYLKLKRQKEAIYHGTLSYWINNELQERYKRDCTT